MGKDPITPPAGAAAAGEITATVTHDERPAAPAAAAAESKSKWKWKMATKTQDGDTAMALFNDVDDLREAAVIDPAEERKLLWRIDLMILPYLAVCYAFFYIDKVAPSSSPLLRVYLFTGVCRRRSATLPSLAFGRICISRAPSITG